MRGQQRKTQWDDLMTLCELGNEAEDETLVPEVEEGFAKLEAEIGGQAVHSAHRRV